MVNSKEKKFVSIKTKFTFILTISVAIALLLSWILIFLYTYSTQKDKTVHSLSQITTIMAENLIATIEFDDKNSANIVLKTLEFNEDIEGAFIYKNKDMQNPFSSYVDKDNNQNKLNDKIISLYKNKDIKKSIEIQSLDRFIISRPIYFEGEYLATFTIVASTKSLNQTLLDQFFMQLIVFFMTLFVVFLIALKMQTIFTTPINEMYEVMEEVSYNNNLDISLKSKYNDEFRLLFDGFNKMIFTIKDLFTQIEKTKQELEKINIHTRESIEYASHIQKAIVPDDIEFKNYFYDYFTLWEPKDIVGGDIYLFESLRDDDECLLMVIDCTGHGVPGAFVTMLVKALERQIVSKIMSDPSIVVSPAWILSYFNKKMKILLKQDEQESISNSGFDGGILYYNKKDKIVKYAGANTPLFIAKDGEIEIMKANRHSIGYKNSDIDYIFDEHIIDVSTDTKLYLSTDGYIDQIGGEKGFPYGKKKFMKSIVGSFDMDLKSQRDILVEKIKEYKGDYASIDDYTIVALEIKNESV